MGTRPHNLTSACLSQASYAKGRAFAVPESVLPRNGILCSNRGSASVSLTSRLHLAKIKSQVWARRDMDNGKWVKGMASALQSNGQNPKQGLWQTPQALLRSLLHPLLNAVCFSAHASVFKF